MSRPSMIRALVAFERTVATVETLTGEPVAEIEAEIRTRSILGHELRDLERDASAGRWPRKP